MKMKTMIAAALALSMTGTSVWASVCGCSSSQITILALSQAQSLTPVAFEDRSILAAERKLELMLLDYDVEFLADYAAMSLSEREIHYAKLDEMRQKRIELLQDVYDAYADAGAGKDTLNILQGHLTTLNLETKDAVAALQRTEALLADDYDGDAYAIKAASLVRVACDELKQTSLSACVADAIGNSERFSAGHLTKFAWVSAPLLLLNERVKQLEAGAAPIKSA